MAYLIEFTPEALLGLEQLSQKTESAFFAKLTGSLITLTVSAQPLSQET